jgi:hypothetical protein
MQIHSHVHRYIHAVFFHVPFLRPHTYIYISHVTHTYISLMPHTYKHTYISLSCNIQFSQESCHIHTYLSCHIHAYISFMTHAYIHTMHPLKFEKIPKNGKSELSKKRIKRHFFVYKTIHVTFTHTYT